MFLHQRARRRRRHAKRCRILSQGVAPTIDSVAETSGSTENEGDDQTNYSLEFVVQYCRTHWPQWVQAAYAEVELLRQDIQDQPSRRIANTLYNVEYLYLRLAKVRGGLIE